MDNSTVSYNEFLDYSDDDVVWKPITDKERPYFFELVSKVRTSLESGTKKEKGDAMEHLMTFVYNRFKAIKVYENVFKGDNQIDHIIEFISGATPTFIHMNVGLRLVGESKNHKKTIGSREVSNLDELLRSKSSKLGIFSSSKSFSKGKTMWNLSEGKRRKLAIASDRRIIGFTIDEIESLINNNFYTMLQQKYNRLIDEIEDDYTDSDNKLSYPDSLYLSVLHLKKIGIIDEHHYNEAIKRLEGKYGSIDCTK